MNERVGIGYFHPGDSRIEIASSSDELEVDKRLTFAALQRAPGATVVVSTGASQQLHVDRSVQLIEGILPWMMVSERHSSSSATSGFATLTTGGLTPIPFLPQSWSGADQSDHMGIDASNTSLDSSATVASLGFGNSSSPLNLNGHSLIVKSGGISLGNGGQINNGTLSTGPDGFNELLFYGRGAVSANIVEDPAAGPLAVTFSPGAGSFNVVYSGNNSYTGPTFVNEGQLDVFTRTALPTGTDLILNGGDVTLRYDSTAANKFGTIRIAGDGSLRSISGQNAIQFDELQLEQGEVREIRLAGSGTIRKTTNGDALLVSITSSGFSGNILVEQGHLGVFGTIPGSIRVTGGSVGVGGGTNPITLDGGALMLGQSPLSSASTYKGNGSIHVASPSKIMGIGIDRVDEAITGTITGAGSLEFTADGLIQQAMGSKIRVSSNNPNFSGDVSIDSLAIELWHSHSLGTGNISVGSGGILSLIGPSHMVVPGDVRLVGGEVRGRSYETEAHELAGDLFVTGRSRVGGVNVLGTTHLENGSSLTVSGRYGTQFVGEMLVGGNVDLEYGLPALSPGSINLGQDNLLQIRGTVSAGAPEATLNFVDRGLVDFQVHGTLKANAGQVLNIRKDGERFVLPLQGPTAGIAGDGTVNGDFALTAGATLAPGQSPGTLVIEGDLEMGSGAVYEWELGDSAWDQVHVDGTLTFSSSVGEPWQLVLSEHQTEMAYEDSEWLIATADAILGFDPTTLEIVTTGLSDGIRSDLAAEFTVEQRGGNLYLVLAVPEPSAMVVAVLLLASGVVFQRRKRTCISK
ncbi:hypothetical protein [Aeoliella sp. SH292]|uniref:hypothetical protein n=1 Tax=Aeoliella sp. SH292 TaxID=3454464 RepID=UPI003F94FD6E